jgi:tetratricopeptide (TPR) repeat protein
VEKLKTFLARANPGALTALAAAAAYLPLLALPFVSDDVLSLRDNPLLRDFSSLAYLFHPDYIKVFRNESFEPLTYLVLMTAGKLFAWQAWGLHLVSVLAHAGCSWSVYRLARSLLGPGWPALAAGLFFALHPVQGESMTAALFSGTLFSAFFFLWALRRFIDGDGGASPGGRLLTALLFGISLLFKERAFPGLLLFCLLPFMRPGGGFKELRRRLPELLPLALAWGAALFSRLAAARGSGLGTDFLDPSFLLARLGAYAKMLALPFWLSPVYQKTSPLPDGAGLAALLLAAGVLYLALGRRQRGELGYAPAAAGAALAGAMLLPYLNLLPVQDLAEYLNSVFVSGRYLYLPMAGAAIVAAAAAARLGEILPPAPLRAAGALLLVLYLFLAAGQQLLWRSEEAVWTRAARLNPGSAWGSYMLGSYYMKEGLPDKAEPLLRGALALNPSRGVRSNTLGALAATALMRGNAALAEKTVLEALAAWDQNYDAWNTYGAALAALGRKTEAAEAFETAASAGITGDAPLLNLGRIRLELGEPAAAAAAFELALARAKTTAGLDLLCVAQAAAGRTDKAAAACLASVELDPGRPEALLRLAEVYKVSGMTEAEGLCRAEAARLLAAGGY